MNTVFKHDSIHNLAAKDRFQQKGFGFFLRHTGCIPIDRQNPDTSWIHESLRMLMDEFIKKDSQHCAPLEVVENLSDRLGVAVETAEQEVYSEICYQYAQEGQDAENMEVHRLPEP